MLSAKRLNLRRAKTRQSAFPAREDSQRMERTEECTILVVDDDEGMRFHLIESVTHLGYKYLAARDGEEALARLRGGAPVDVVLCDIKMPGISGLDLLEVVRAEHSADVIMMTGYVEEYAYDRILELGASDFLHKPITMNELRVRLKRVLRERWLLACREAARRDLEEAAKRLKTSYEELRQAHEELLRARKLQSIGQLAAGIAHEINTPMQYVSNNTEYVAGAFSGLAQVFAFQRGLLEKARLAPLSEKDIGDLQTLEEEHDVEFALEEIPGALAQTLEGVARVSNIVHSIKQFAHPGTDKKAPADLNQAIESTITVARGEWKHTAAMETDLDPGLPPVVCAQGEINQVILNMIVNAAHAIADKNSQGKRAMGLIRVSTRYLPETGEAEIRVTDDGAGIPEEARARIFDPFFTTKGVGVGTGQGLAIAHTIVVEKHRGTIDFETRTGDGTTFFIRLPVEERV
jgi:signal transduction histidine kinase